MVSNGTTRSASSSKPGFSHLQGVFDNERSIARKRMDLLSVGAVGTSGRLRSEEYDGGGGSAGACIGCNDCPGIVGACLEGC